MGIFEKRNWNELVEMSSDKTDVRADRVAQQMRDNLRKRKALTRSRTASLTNDASEATGGSSSSPAKDSQRPSAEPGQDE